MFKHLFQMVGLLVAAGLISGCLTDTRLVKDSLVLQTQPDQPYATIYFLRESMLIHNAPARDPVTIDINGHDVMRLSQGEYAMIRIKPTEGTVRMRSHSLVGNKPVAQEIFGERTFNFAAGQTNFLRTKMVDGGFRGVYFVPERIEFNQARALVERLRPAGEARRYPIDQL